MLAPAGAAVEQLGGALERTLAALEPYLMQLRLESEARRCVSRPSGGGRGLAAPRLLSPLGAIYGAIAAQRMAQPGMRAGMPVICVGNFTSAAPARRRPRMALAALLRELGETPVVLSRGYGGASRGPVGSIPRATRRPMSATSRCCWRAMSPMVVARDRVAGAALARARRRASVIVMDDGFQNPSLDKDCRLIVVDGGRGIGNGRCFRPGRCARRCDAADSPRTDALLVIGDGAQPTMARRRSSPGQAGVSWRSMPDAAAVAALRGKRVLAFAGIGDPEKFFRTLRRPVSTWRGRANVCRSSSRSRRRDRQPCAMQASAKG